MPYQISLEKKFPVPDPDGYWNDVCFGGDVIVDTLLPSLRTRFEFDHSNQEDWGWFIWLRKGRIKLGVEITCEDREKGRYRLELWSRQSVFLWWDRAADTPELEALREDVQKSLSSWLGSTPPVKRV